ncbi:PIG-L family deacetylase [Bacillus sp. sid0103]|uniref:sugar-binding protein n=1 Tax=Bacillus sp. sid0103 TaxID=2856337 RepID=UPI001C49376C|nr:sugar-binding protein [Bacillus sp. sid0103]MBV7504283.1 PIG-L family deacetylase [Bacillus sp. sid0103]
MKKKFSTIARTLTLTMMCSLFPLGSSLAKTEEKPVDLDMLFIGAHPDDEAGGLSTYGQWIEQYNYHMGVLTITRGEGGGNAVGPEEGSDLGILREKEERNAISIAGINHVFNLDKVDFYYNVSAPLTEKVWGHDSTLEKVVRTIRMTKPEIIFTMNPSPTPGNHGNHQYAARMAVEAFYAAADPTKFPEQISKERLSPWKAKKIVYRGANGVGTNLGEKCETTFVPAEPTDKVYSIWSGRKSTKQNKTWGQLERDAQRIYESQGWKTFEDVPSDPNQLSCDRFTEFDSRVPITKDNQQSTSLLEGALLSNKQGLPLGTELSVTTSNYKIVPGDTFEVNVEVTNNSEMNLKDATLTLELPVGLEAEKNDQVSIKQLNKGETKEFSFKVKASQTMETKRYRLNAKLAVGEKQGFSSRVIEGVSAVQATLQPLPHVKEFQEWTGKNRVQHLQNLIKPVFSIGLGETRNIQVNVTNNSSNVQSGEVSIQLPEGFQTLQPSVSIDSMKPNETKAIQFSVTNTNPSLKTSNEGGTNGDYDFTITTKTMEKSVVQTAAINLVPITDIHQATTQPAIDGEAHEGEYLDQDIDLSRVWEGTVPTSSMDASGHAKVSWDKDSLYFYVNVQDDLLGTVLDKADAKRHWRTDSVEIAIDPQGNSENTSSTFKVGIFPTTTEHKPAAYRDADNHQGPIELTAPGMEIASKINEDNYNGYSMEVRIPFSVLPAAVDPEKFAFNIFVYDSDTKDKTGQTRLGWSTWGGVQGDPYRWGHGKLEDYQPDGKILQPTEPFFPIDVTKSVLSPQSILQSSLNGVPLASGRAAEQDSIMILGQPKVDQSTVKVKLKAQNPGIANVFLWSNNRILDKKTIDFKFNQQSEAVLQYPSDKLPETAYVLISYETEDGKTESISYPIGK